MEMALKCLPTEKEFEKNPQMKPTDVKIFRQWLAGQPHLPSDKISGK